MIKRIIGAVFALCILAVIVFTVLGRGTYTSLIGTGAAAGVEAAAESADLPSAEK